MRARSPPAASPPSTSASTPTAPPAAAAPTLPSGPSGRVQEICLPFPNKGDSPCMMTRRRGCLHFQPIQLLLCVMNLSCKWQKLEAKLSFGGTPLFQIANIKEDVERKFQHVASSVHKMGMVLDSVQNDVYSHEGGITRFR